MRAEQRRLVALTAAIRPTQSLAAKLEGLTSEQRAVYKKWRKQTDEWCPTFTNFAGAYQAMLNGDEGPRLRRDVRYALCGPDVKIPADATVGEAAEIYRCFAQRELIHDHTPT